MPDITMCQDSTCDMRLKCWRFIAPCTPEWQSYFGEILAKPCEYFWDAEEYMGKEAYDARVKHFLTQEIRVKQENDRKD
jgi:hypothetical protein